MAAAVTDRYLETGDGVRLHYRDFAGGRAGQPAILCLPGLTRNVRDFESLARHLAPRFRILTTSFRGRGESGHDPDPMHYAPPVYAGDLKLLLKDAGADRVIVVGTSLGGLVGLMLGAAGAGVPDVAASDAAAPDMAAIVLNDVGPVLEAAGLARIRAAIGRGDNWPSFLMAARDIARLQHDIYPDWTLESWLAHAKRLCRIAADGRIVWDYDPEIAAPLNLPNSAAGAGVLDLWPAFESGRDRPMLSIRGELSDILSAETQAEMTRRLPGLTPVIVPHVGHAPTLAEEPALQAIDRFLQQLA